VYVLYLAVVLEQLEEKAGDDAGDADEKVDDDEEDVRGAGFSEHEGRRVHHWTDRPPTRRRRRRTHGSLLK